MQEKGENVDLYEHTLFRTVGEVMEIMDELSFKDASTMIGSSLIEDFSEIDSNEGSGADN